MEAERYRDAGLALGAVAWLVAMLARDDALWALRNSRAAVTGIGSALVVEWAFLRHPERLLALWDHPAVSGGSTLAMVGGAAVARRRPRLLAAGVWGLLAYLALFVRLLVSGQRSQQQSVQGSNEEYFTGMASTGQEFR